MIVRDGGQGSGGTFLESLCPRSLSDDSFLETKTATQ